MSNQTIIRDPDTIHSGSTYASDPAAVEVIEIVDTRATNIEKTNDFTHVRDVRQIATSGLAVLSTGFFALSIIMLLLQIIPVAILMAFGGIAAGLVGVAIGRTRSYKHWGYQLASYAAIASAVLAVILISAIYITQTFTF